MSDESENAPISAEIHEGDILFDCPYCGKSMAIEAAGAGLMVPCASCGKPVQVPIPGPDLPEVPAGPAYRPEADGDEGNLVRQMDAALTMANEQIDRLIVEKESLQERRAYLEQLRMANGARFERIAEELATVQDALDRALALLAEARAEKPS